MSRILVIEDDSSIRQGIVDALEFDGFKTLEAAEGHKGLALALKCDYDLLLLDLVLPGMDGLEILREIRRHRPTQPVIILTARGAENDRVQGLRLGADDYVVKPFSVKELLARIDAVIRRSPERPTGIEEVDFPGGRADLKRCEVRFEDGESTSLSEREMEILAYLARNSGRAISRDEILTRVWRISTRGVETRTIDMHIARLREKLRDNKENPKVILTVRGKGYMLATPSASTINHQPFFE
ncbi:MAG: response regulator transcription factor [Planctomycetota bacterium]|nr:response regulator transcription factor [Planctomycetota bacterium]MDA1141658.1 response regulator transcription factor [Planctomycetota bacterium]